MAEVLTMRLKDRDKEMLTFTSKLTGIPSSKMLQPFVAEAVRVNLGAAILFNIDRSAPFNRRRFEEFLGRIKPLSEESVRIGDGPLTGIEMEGPRVLTDFFWMLKEVKAAERMMQAMGDIEIVQDLSFMDIWFMRGLCLSLGDSYISKGLSLSRFEMDQARRVFFAMMLSRFYRSNAKGTAKALTTKWYTHQDLVMKLVEEMASRYELRYPAKVVDAIEVKEAIPVVQRKPMKRTPSQGPGAQPGR